MLTIEQQRIKLREQLKRELFQSDKAKPQTKKKKHKPIGAIHSSREKFLKNPKNRKDPNEKREW